MSLWSDLGADLRAKQRLYSTPEQVYPLLRTVLADGVVTEAEIEAFDRIFRVPEEERATVRRR